jgi:uncharacterized membrane protein YphA (DoxX/SURF4 family)
MNSIAAAIVPENSGPIVLTQLVAGPMLALGLFTRLAASPIVVFLIVTDYERWRVGGFFWNKMGLEFTAPDHAAMELA